MSDAFNDDELHAFVDGALDSEREKVMAERIANDPALAKRAADYRADMVLLKRFYGPLSTRPLPQEWLALARQPVAERTLSWRMVGTIAAAIVVGILGTLAVQSLKPGRANDIVDVALEARASPSVTEQLNATDAHAHDDANALSAVLGVRVNVPSMARLGYRLAEIRLYRASGASELVYRNGDRVFTLYLHKSDGVLRFDQFNRGGLRVCIWQDQVLAAVMAGNVSTAAMQRLASLAYTGLTL